MRLKKKKSASFVFEKMRHIFLFNKNIHYPYARESASQKRIIFYAYERNGS